MPSQLNIYCDGGARGNPGPAASAFIVKDSSGQIIHEQGFYLGTSTNNQAEYQAVIESLKWLSTTNYKLSTVNYYLDSQLVVNQLKGTFKVKDENLKLKKQEVEKLLDQLGQLEIRNFVYVPRTQNSRADFVVNKTLDNHS
ncbi:MAG: ribonuclease HI family protein [Patescibacteria group bacterium]